MTLDEEYFPRGGKPKSTQKEGTRGIVKKKNDNLFKVNSSTFFSLILCQKLHFM